MSKYQPLTEYLRGQGRQEVPMTFKEIERVIGIPLPPSKVHRAWWSNNPSNNVMTKAWLAAGYETQQVDVPLERLKFVRRHATKPADARGKEGSHPAWGSLKGTTVVKPGVDLTAPIAPDWGRLDDE